MGMLYGMEVIIHLKYVNFTTRSVVVAVPRYEKVELVQWNLDNSDYRYAIMESVSEADYSGDIGFLFVDEHTGPVERCESVPTATSASGRRVPVRPLTVESTSFDGFRIKRTTSGGGSAMELINGDDDEWTVGVGGTGTFGIYTGGTFGQQFTIDASGNVGIGNTSPTCKLHIMGNDTNANQHFTSMVIDHNCSGGGTNTGDFNHMWNFDRWDSIWQQVVPQGNLQNIWY